MSLSSFKRKWIEKWLADVGNHLQHGDMCRTVIDKCLEDPNGSVHLWIPKSPSSLQNQEKIKKERTMTDTTDCFKDSSALPLVKFNYSHIQTDVRRSDRRVKGLPALIRPSTHTDDCLVGEDKDRLMPILIVHGEESVRLKREDLKSELETAEKSTLLSSPTMSQRCSQQLSRSGVHLKLSSHVFMNGTLHTERSKTAPFKNNIKKARKLLAKRTPAIHAGDGQNHIPMQNCWTMAELTW